MNEQPMENQPVTTSHALPDTLCFTVESLLEELPAAYYVCNAKAEIIEFNLLAVEVWGRSPSPGQAETDFFNSFRTYEDINAKSDSPLINCLKDGISRKNQQSQIHNNNGTFTIIENISPLFANGVIAGAVNLFYQLPEKQDENKRGSEKHLRKSITDLEAKNFALNNSDEIYHKMIGEIEDYAIILLDRDGTILNWNKGAEKIKGYKKEEIVGKNFRKFYTEEDRKNEKPEMLIQHAAYTGKALDEGWRVRKDGTRFWGSIVITALHDSKGEVTGFVKVTRDLTSRRETEEQLKKSEERYHKMVEEVEDYAIILLDKDGTILNWNKGAEKIKGYKQEEIVGKNFRLFYTDEDRATHKADRLIHTALTKGKALDEGWRVRKDGTRFWGSIVITALHDDKGEVSGFVKVTRELTEKKQAEEELKKSEERYHRMIDQVEDYAIILLDKDGMVLNWNKGAEKIKGYKQEEIVGKSFRNFYTDEDRRNNKPDKLLALAKETGKALDEGWRVRKDGTRFWGSIVITALHDDNGETTGFVKVTRDLTQRKEAEEELKRSEERYHKMIDEIEDYAIILLDKNGMVLNWNKGAEKIKGYSQEEIVGKNFSVFYPPEDIENKKPERLITEAFTTGKAADEGWRMRKDGMRFWGSIVITALHNPAGEVIGFSKVTRDLTERKFAEDKLREYSNELEFQNKELEQFAYAASHDMKEPLRKIHLYNSFINENQNNSLDAKSREYLNRSINAVKRMNDLIEDLLTYSKSTSTVESFEKTDVNVLLKDIVAQHKEEFEQKHVSISIDKMPEMYVVPFQFNQLMDNLVSNSIKYSHPERNVEIDISYKSVKGSKNISREAIPDMDYHLITVKDNGIGFEPQYEQKVFEIFQRLSNPTGAKGSGIGLAICKKIVQNHKGFIRAKGKLNEGATFQVYLPADPDHLFRQ
jgi:PAS domain S-box-containing protein